MKNKYNGSSENFESKETSYTRSILNKHEFDLFYEEKDVVEKVIRVKRVQMPNKCEKWKIFENTKAVFVLDGTKISKKEKEFLYTIDGVNFLISQYKDGIRSLNKLKVELKKRIENK